MMNKLLIFALTLLLLSCASTSNKYIEPNNLNDENSALVTIYRTDVSYHSLNPEKPFFYLDNNLVGKLGTGDYVSFKVSPGEHSLTSKESILFVPSKESGNVKGLFKAKEIYYFRYSKEHKNTISTGTGFFMTDSTTLQPVTESDFNERK